MKHTYRYNTEQDKYPIDPREHFDNLCTMLCMHKRYNLGDKYKFSDSQELIDSIPENCYKLPLYLYDHSGITISTAPFDCKWDSGQIGYIYITSETLTDNWLDDSYDSAVNVMQSEVNEYDQYLRGDVYGYTIEKLVHYKDINSDKTLDDWELIDSCWGFYDKSSAISEAESMIKYYQDKDTE